MTNEDKLAGEIARISELHKENKNIDTAALLQNVLAEQGQDSIPAGQKTRAYLISLLFPPIRALLFCEVYYSG